MVEMKDDVIYRQMAIDALDCINGTEEVLRSLPSAQPDIDKQELIRTITAGIIATNTKDVYSCGMRNGMRWCRALLEEDAPTFEDASLYAQLEIVRCKDCKHADEYFHCSYTPWWNRPDDFCSRAERREE